MKTKSVFGNVTESKNAFAGKTIAIATALVAVLSFGALGAYGAGGALDNPNTSVTATSEDAVVVSFPDDQFATAFVLGQPVNGTGVQTILNQPFTFELVPEDGYVVTELAVTNNDGEVIFLEGEGPEYTIAAEDVRGTINVTYAAVAYPTIPGANVEGEQTIPEIVITTPSASKIYDGEPLTAVDVVEVQFPEVEELYDVMATFQVTGSQTEVGSSTNTYSLDWGNVDSSKYKITENLGTLTVHPNEAPIVIAAPTASKVYDGQPLTATEAEIAAPEGVVVTATVEGTITDAGTVATKVADYAILDEAGNDVSTAYAAPQIEEGTLTITPAPLTVNTPSDTKEYDGQPLTATATNWISGFVNDETADAQITGTQTEVGASPNTYEITWNGTAKKDNYLVTETLGVLEVTQAAQNNNGGNNNGGTNNGGSNNGGTNNGGAAVAGGTTGGTTGGGTTGGTGAAGGTTTGGGTAAATGSGAAPTYGATSVASTPGVSYESTDAGEGVTGASVAGAAAGSAAPAAGPVEAVAEGMQNAARGVIGEDPIPLTAPLTAELDENGTPLGAFDEPADNWVRWYVVVGIIATALYGIAVLMRRRNFTKGLEDQENSMLGLSSTEEAASAVPADAAVRRA